MFGGAVISLAIAVAAAVVGYGGLPDAAAATLGQNVFLIAIGIFVVNAVVAILDVELPQVQPSALAKVIRGGKSSPDHPLIRPDVIAGMGTR